MGLRPRSDRAGNYQEKDKGVPAVLLLYRRDRDVPPWTGLRTAGCHLAPVRRVFERRPDIQLITFDRLA
jgi:hypothetical protein